MCKRVEPPCPAGVNGLDWDKQQHEKVKEARAASLTRWALVAITIVLVVCAGVTFVMRDQPEAISEDVRALAKVTNVDLTKQEEMAWRKKEEASWRSIDKETRSAARTAFLGVLGLLLGFVFRGYSSKKVNGE